CEYRFRRRDDTYAMLLDRGYIARDHSGRAIRMIGSMLDLTERHRTGQSLRASRDELERRVSQRTEELQHRADQLARLTSQLTLTEQRERRRLAQVLHDHLQQLLVGAKFKLGVLARQAAGSRREDMAEVEGL